MSREARLNKLVEMQDTMIKTFGHEDARVIMFCMEIDAINELHKDAYDEEINQGVVNQAQELLDFYMERA